MCGCRKNLPIGAPSAGPRRNASRGGPTSAPPATAASRPAAAASRPAAAASRPAAAPSAAAPSVAATAHSVGAPPTATRSAVSASMPEPVLEVAYWGPRVWKLLHTLAERVGMSGRAIADSDAGNALNYIIQRLPEVLPCSECSTHAATYLLANKFNASGRIGKDLQSYVRDYLFAFHNTVRERKGQTPFTMEEYTGLYKEYTQLDSNELRDTLRRAVFYRIIRSELHMNWAIALHKLKLMLGMPS